MKLLSKKTVAIVSMAFLPFLSLIGSATAKNNSVKITNHSSMEHLGDEALELQKSEVDTSMQYLDRDWFGWERGIR